MVFKAMKRKKEGFTLIEITAVVIIVGVLATLAMTKAPVAMYRVKNQEATQLLLAVYGGQMEYEQDTGGFTTSMSDLDITITNIKNFNNLVLRNLSAVNCVGGAEQYLARLDAILGGYTLYVLDTGEIVCTPCGGTCQKMGFRTF